MPSFAQTLPFAARPHARVLGRVDRNSMHALRGTHPAVVDEANVGARLNAGTQLNHMVMVLEPSDAQKAALVSLLDSQQDKSSPNYHKWLTPDTFGQSFGVAPADISQVTSWLSDSGMQVESVSRGGRFVTFSGTVGTVESTFHTQMHHLTVKGEVHISNTTDISVPTALLPVVKGVARLNNFFSKSTAHDPKRVKINPADQTIVPEYGSSSTGTHYVGAGDIQTIYNATPLINAGIDGTGTTIAVLARSNITLTDVATYRSLFGLPKNDPTITVVGQDPGLNADDIEAYLDAEMAGAVAPNAKVNFIVSSPSLVQEGIDAAGLYAVDNNVGDIITLSYGGCETASGASTSTFWNTLWEEAAAQGQTVFVSSGDSGAAGCASSSATSAGTTGYAVNVLGSSNYNVAVGGSMFVDFGPAQYWASGISSIPYTTALGYIPEAALNQGRLTTTLLNGTSTATVAGTGIFAGGGGISIFVARPSWQTGSGISPTTDPSPGPAPAGQTVTGTGVAAGGKIAGPHRLVPDVSFISANGHDGTLFCAEGSCYSNASGGLANAGIVGGTSVAAPAMASVQALINNANGGRQGNANYYYYALANQQYTASTTACQAPIGSATSPTVALPASTCNFHDIISGSIIVPTDTTTTNGIGFSALAGFDVATGLGSMNIANVANNWKTVSFKSTTTTFSLTPTTTTHGSNQSAQIQVTSNTGTPTGDVALIAMATLGTGTPQVFTLTNGSINGLVTSLPGGTYTVYAHYAGDGTYAPSDSAPVTVNISKEDSVMGFAAYKVTSAGSVSATSTFTYGAVNTEVYLDLEMASNSGTTASNGSPSGTITFAVTKDGSPLPSLTTKLDSLGTSYLISGPAIAAFYLVPNYAILGGGSYSVTATYSGDASFNGTSQTIAFTVARATPTIAFTAATADVAAGAPGTLNFTITTPASYLPATGTITVTDSTTGATGIASVVNGKAVYTSAALAAGSHSFTAVYSGDGNFASATSSTVTVTAGPTISTTTTVALNGNTTVGAAVPITATVSPVPTSATPVYFYDGGVLLGTANASATTGVATLSVSTFTGGAHTLTATFAGTATQKTSTGSLAATIAARATTTNIGGTETASVGDTVYFNGVISRSGITAAPVVALGGVVNFYDGTTLLGSATPVFGPGGYGYYIAAFSTTALTGGSHSITAAYQGDGSYGASTSIALPVTITKKAQTITFTGLPSSATFGSAGPYTLNGTSSSGLPVSYTVSGPGVISGNTLTITGPGTVTVTAFQAGDANYGAATPVSQTIVVNSAPTGGTAQLTASASIVKSNGNYVVTVHVVNSGTGTALNVTLTGVTLGSAAGTPVPQSLGSLAAGASMNATVTVPGSAGNSGSASVERITGTYTGGSFGGSYRVTLP